jgi:hypothetical protein
MFVEQFRYAMRFHIDFIFPFYVPLTGLIGVSLTGNVCADSSLSTGTSVGSGLLCSATRTGTKVDSSPGGARAGRAIETVISGMALSRCNGNESGTSVGDRALSRFVESKFGIVIRLDRLE